MLKVANHVFMEIMAFLFRPDKKKSKEMCVCAGHQGQESLLVHGLPNCKAKPIASVQIFTLFPFQAFHRNMINTPYCRSTPGGSSWQVVATKFNI